jgi:CRP-like cAMP-binding protein
VSLEQTSPSGVEMTSPAIDTSVKLMKTVDFFSKFEDEELVHIAKASLIKKYANFDYVVQEGIVDDCSFYIILGGKLAVFKNRKGFAQKIALLGKGDSFGEMSILLEEARSTTVQATTDCFLICINSQAIQSMPQATQTKLAWAIGRSNAIKLKRANIGAPAPPAPQ